MTDGHLSKYEKAMQATVKRLSAENTWLRHNHMEMESRIENMHRQVDGLETRIKALKKTLTATAAKSEQKSRSTT